MEVGAIQENGTDEGLSGSAIRRCLLNVRFAPASRPKRFITPCRTSADFVAEVAEERGSLRLSADCRSLC